MTTSNAETYMVAMEAVYMHKFFGPFATIEQARNWTENYVSRPTSPADWIHDGDGHHDFVIYKMIGFLQSAEIETYAGDKIWSNDLQTNYGEYEWKGRR